MIFVFEDKKSQLKLINEYRILVVCNDAGECGYMHK